MWGVDFGLGVIDQYSRIHARAVRYADFGEAPVGVVMMKSGCHQECQAAAGLGVEMDGDDVEHGHDVGDDGGAVNLRDDAMVAVRLQE